MLKRRNALQVANLVLFCCLFIKFVQAFYVVDSMLFMTMQFHCIMVHGVNYVKN